VGNGQGNGRGVISGVIVLNPSSAVSVPVYLLFFLL